MINDPSNVVSLQDETEQKQKKIINRMLKVTLVASSESNCNERLSAFFSKLAQSQEPLGAEFEKILNDNIYDLYLSD